MIEHDLDHADRASVRTDLLVLLKSVAAVLGGMRRKGGGRFMGPIAAGVLCSSPDALFNIASRIWILVMKPGVKIGAFGATAAAVAVLGAVLVFQPDGSVSSAGYVAPGLEAMGPDAAVAESFRLAPALLTVVYDAFGLTEEAEIYDTLARVAHDDALEQLYLERVGAMAGGGLNETDQTIHELRVEGLSTTRRDETLNMDAVWQVIGTVGHAEHMHVRGNTYSATLEIAPVDGAWKITQFQLLDVNRDAAGEMFPAPEAPG